MRLFESKKILQNKYSFVIANLGGMWPSRDAARDDEYRIDVNNFFLKDENTNLIHHINLRSLQELLLNNHSPATLAKEELFIFLLFFNSLIIYFFLRTSTGSTIMGHSIRQIWLFLCFLMLWNYPLYATPKAILLEIKEAIGPATQDYIHRGIDQAIRIKADLVILKMDTPGGLDKAMRDIIKDILASPLPIVTYVAPNGARAASAGTYIMYASHIAAMAPATNLGAATPVFIESPIPSSLPNQHDKEKPPQTSHEAKAINDAVAYIQGLATLHNRNKEWAEKAVREAASLQAEEALKIKVIDFIAADIPELLKKLDERPVTIQSQSKILKTHDMVVENWPPDWRVRFLQIITDPSISYILLLIGIYGLFFEFSNPGFVLPGVMGIVAFLLALYALQLLPVNYAGFGLILIGLSFMASELYITSHGIMGIGGVIAFVAGSILLFDYEGYAAVPWNLIIGMGLFSTIFFLIIVQLAVKARQQKIVSGIDTLVGCIGIVQESFKEKGWVKVRGESWKARSLIPLRKGQKVKIINVTGLELLVEPFNNHGD